MKYNYIIYHHNCIDGFTGFYLFIKSKQWEKKPIVYYDQPYAKKIPPNIEGKNVIIIDVAYNPHIIKQIAELSNRMLFIDHHVSIREGILKLKLKKPNEIVYDVNKSGASLVWHYFFKKKMPKFVKYIEDNDIGRWKYSETVPFILSLRMHYTLEPTYNNLKKWDKLLNNNVVNKMIKEGYNYQEYDNYLALKNSKKTSIMYFPSELVTTINNRMLNNVGQYKIAIINGGCPSVSSVGKKIMETVNCDFCVVWNYIITKQKYVISLRSNKMDVSKIAAYFGGGGHKKAASFSLSSNDYKIDDLFVSLTDDKL